MTKRGLSGGTLKWIAVISMLVDHAAVVFYVASREAGQALLSRDLYFVLRSVGRLAFPLYAFLLTEGFFHTRSVKKYLFRLLLFGAVSEIPFDLAFRGVWLEGSYQNVYFTLTLGLLAVWLWMRATDGDARSCGVGRILLGLMGIAATALLAWLGKTDYGAWGVLTLYYPAGRVHEVTFLGENAEPTNAKDGYAILEYEEDENGNRVYEGYFDELHAQTNCAAGYSNVERGYDSEGRLISERYQDRYNKLTNNVDGVAAWNGYYDENGELVITNCYDQDRNPVTVP